MYGCPGSSLSRQTKHVFGASLVVKVSRSEIAMLLHVASAKPAKLFVVANPGWAMPTCFVPKNTTHHLKETIGTMTQQLWRRSGVWLQLINVASFEVAT